MPKQSERDVRANVTALKDALDIEGGKFSGGAIEHFIKGWAKDIWAGRVAHYWFRNDFMACHSICGLVTPAQWVNPSGETQPRMYGAGNLPRCKRCEKRR